VLLRATSWFILFLRVRYALALIENRFDRYKGKKYDIIQGPVANDDVYPTILLYESGDLTTEEALNRLKSRKLFDQIALCTENALSLLTFKEAFGPEGSEYDQR
jgi:hypothetical protein